MVQNSEAKDRDAALEQVKFGVFELLLRRWWLVGLGLLVTLGLAALYQTQAPPRYVSRAQVLVNKRRPDVVPGALSTPVAVEEYLATQAALIRSPLIVERAVKAERLDSLKTFAEDTPGMAYVVQGLSVRRDPRDKSNSILEVSFRGLSPDESEKVLDAVISSYEQFLRENYQSVSEETLSLIDSAQGTLQKNLAHKEKEYLEFRRKNPSLVKRGESAQHLHNEMLLTLHSKRLALQVRRAELEGMLKQMEEAKKVGGNEKLLAMLHQIPNRTLAEGGARSESFGLEDKLILAVLEEGTLSTEFSSPHPQVMAARKKVELAFNVVKSILQIELACTRTAEQSLTQVFEAKTSAAQQGIQAEDEDELYHADLTRLGQLIDATTKRLQDIEVARALGGYEALVVGKPTQGELALESQPLVIYSGAALLGLVGGLGLALVFPATPRPRDFQIARSGLGVSGTSA
jgi:uncharacterized protein involved in exopolysaccharide biosynthesis